MAHMKVGQISSSTLFLQFIFFHFKYLKANKCLPWWGLDSSFSFLNCWKSSRGLGNYHQLQPSRETNSRREKEKKSRRAICDFGQIESQQTKKATLGCRRVNSAQQRTWCGEAIDSQLDVIGSIWSNIRLAFPCLWNINGTCISNSTRYACISDARVYHLGDGSRPNNKIPDNRLRDDMETNISYYVCVCILVVPRSWNIRST